MSESAEPQDMDDMRDAHLASNDEGAKEYPLIGPLFEGDVEMGPGPVEIDEGGQDNRDFYFGTSEDVIGHDGKS